MRILHTSDWHLGQELHGHDRQYEHHQFLKWLTGLIIENNVDALLIAGDVYDTTNPPASAQRMFFNFLLELTNTVADLQIVVTAGNHDSASRLEAPSQLLNAFSTHVVGRVGHSVDGLFSENEYLIPLSSKGSKVPELICVALPYLRTADLHLPGESISYPEAVMRVYHESIKTARQKYGPQIPLIALGHLHATGGTTSDDSERKLVIGGEVAVPISALASEFAYVALGHLHKAQRVGGHDHIRYCGSPLPMSLSEINYKHQVILVDVALNSEVQIRELHIPRTVEMLRCPAKPLDLDQAIAALRDLKFPQVHELITELKSKNIAFDPRPFLEIPVRVSGPMPEMQAKIDEVVKHLPVRIARISRHSEEQSKDDEGKPLVDLDTLRGIDPILVFESVHAQQFNGNAPSAELRAVFEEALRAVNEGDGQ